MGKKNNIRQHFLFHDYYSRLKTIALSVFKWENLPDSCNARFLEECLFRYGQAVFVNDPTMSYLNLKVTPSTTLNVYEEPTGFVAYSTGYSREYKANECVWVKNNDLLKSTDSTILFFAERLTAIELALMVNINAQKTPILIRCDEKTRMSLQAIYDQYEGNSPVIFGVKALTDKPLEAIMTGAPYVADKLREEKRAVWNEALEFLGINTNPADKKKERVVVSEVNANNEQIDIQALTLFKCRQEAADKFNAMFGQNVKVTQRVEELRKLFESQVRLYGNIPDDYMQEVIDNG